MSLSFRDPSKVGCFKGPDGLQLPAATAKAVVFDHNGRTIWEPALSPYEKPVWDGRDPFGDLAPQGNYLCKLTLDTGETFYMPFVLMY
jgi:hypothetical protein